MGKRQAVFKREHTTRIADTRREEKREFIPRLCTLRRIAPRYRCMLPLRVMQRYQCIIVGGKRGILTVAIVHTNNERVMKYLREQTGCAIFPVLIEPERMRLLLRRAEWSEYNRESVKRNTPLLHPLFLHSLLPLLSRM